MSLDPLIQSLKQQILAKKNLFIGLAVGHNEDDPKDVIRRSFVDAIGTYSNCIRKNSIEIKTIKKVNGLI